MTRQKTWHIEDIKAELRKRHGSLAALSRLWGLNPRAISVALAQPGHSRATEKRVAAALEVLPHELWPTRWSSDGSPISQRVDRTPTRSRKDALRAKRSAA